MDGTWFANISIEPVVCFSLLLRAVAADSGRGIFFYCFTVWSLCFCHNTYASGCYEKVVQVVKIPGHMVPLFTIHYNGVSWHSEMGDQTSNKEGLFPRDRPNTEFSLLPLPHALLLLLLFPWIERFFFFQKNGKNNGRNFFFIKIHQAYRELNHYSNRKLWIEVSFESHKIVQDSKGL